MLAKNAAIYKYLKGLENWINNFRDSFDIYYLIFGYYTALVRLDIAFEEEQKWIFDFLYFVERELAERNKSKHFGGHIGVMLLIAVDWDKEKSIKLFYELLDEFVDIYIMENRSGKLVSNIERP